MSETKSTGTSATLARMAGNIAGSMLTTSDLTHSDADLLDAVAKLSVSLARKIIDEIRRTDEPFEAPDLR
jgi:hypothetical protein